MIDTNNLIEKSKSLVWAKFNDYTTNELKLVEVYLSRINARDPESCNVSFTKKEYCELMGLHPDTDASQLKKYTRRFLGNVVTIDTEKGYRQYTLFTRAECEVDNKLGQNVVRINCNPELKEVFFNLSESKYVKYRLRNIISLKSQYSIRLYSLLKDSTWGNFEWQVELKELRELLGATQKSYESFKEFNRAVLTKCQKEINKNTDLQFSYEKIMQGRLTKSIKFKINSVQQVIDEPVSLPEKKSKTEYFNTISEEPELTIEQKYIKRINEEAFRSEFNFKTAEYLVEIGRTIAQSRVSTDNLIDAEAATEEKIRYYKEKYLQMNLGATSKSAKSRANYLAALLKADVADSLGFIPDKKEKGKYVPKDNKFNNFKRRSYDFDELEKMLLNV